MLERHSPEISHVRVDSAGRIVVPSGLRHQLGIKPGSDLILSADADGIHLQTFDQAVRTAQQALAPYRIPGKSVVDELIRERRAEAKKDRQPPKRPPRA